MSGHAASSGAFCARATPENDRENDREIDASNRVASRRVRSARDIDAHLRVRRAAVLDARRVGGRLVDRAREPAADRRVRLLRLRGRRRHAGADRPHGLVRDDDAPGGAVIEVFKGATNKVLHIAERLPKDHFLHFVLDEGHLKCVFALAELVAQRWCHGGATVVPRDGEDTSCFQYCALGPGEVLPAEADRKYLSFDAM